jgi:hypothetical protein
MKHFTTGRIALALLATGVLFLSLAPVASAWNGNSDNAKRCHNGGYARLYDASTGLHFTSQGACVSAGAHGRISSLTLHPVGGPGFAGFTVSGFGLEPNSQGSFTLSSGGLVLAGFDFAVDSHGTTSGSGASDNCALEGISSVTGAATATTSRGATISVKATEPC